MFILQKSAHGHVKWLIDQKVDFIFYPCIPYETSGDNEDPNNHYNCPIVTSYAENIKNNVDEITSGSVRFLNPFMSFGSKEALTKRLVEEFQAEFQSPGSGNPVPAADVLHGKSLQMPVTICGKKVKKPCNI